jgi:exosortase family protein XrtM
MTTLTRRAWGWRVLAFGLIFLSLQSFYGSAKWLERVVIDGATVRTAAALIGLYAPEIGVKPLGSRLVSPGGSLNVLNGCEGTDVAFLLCAALLVAPLHWRQRLQGLALGMALVFVLNQVRLLALFHVHRSEPAWFSLLHSTVGPLVLVICVGLFFAYWLTRVDRSGPAGAGPKP